MATKAKRIGNWTPDGKAERLLAQKEYRESTPGQRVEEAIILSHQIGKLAARGRARARAERS